MHGFRIFRYFSTWCVKYGRARLRTNLRVMVVERIVRRGRKRSALFYRFAIQFWVYTIEIEPLDPITTHKIFLLEKGRLSATFGPKILCMIIESGGSIFHNMKLRELNQTLLLNRWMFCILNYWAYHNFHTACFFLKNLYSQLLCHLLLW